MIRRTFVVAVGVLVALLGFAPALHAGGWALTELDPLPRISAGESAMIGFTILQHGRTPVAVDDVSIEVRDSSGVIMSFEADPQATEGRYVAAVVFPHPGQYSWLVRQGWFGPHELGELRVKDGAVASTREERSPPWSSPVSYALMTGALFMFGLVAWDRLRGRRRVVAS